MELFKIFAILHDYCFTVTVTNANSGTLLQMFTVIVTASSLDRAIKKFDSSVNWVEVAGSTVDVRVDRV
jgi:hypothetical protein